MGSGAAALSDVRYTEPEALGNLAAVLQLCAAGKMRCSEKTRRPSAVTTRTVAEALVAGDYYPDEAIASFAWPLLLQAGGLARLEGPRLTLTPKGHKALGRPGHEVIRALWERWPRHAPIDEFSRVDQIKGQKSAATLSAAGPRRQAVAAALALCPQGEWIAVDDLFVAMRRADLSPTIARSERGLWKLYLGDPEYGSLGYAGFHDWPLLEGRYTIAVLFEYAATLGLLDVDYVAPGHARDDFRQLWGADWIDALSRYDGLRAVRLTALELRTFLDERAVHAVPATVDRLLADVEARAGRLCDLGTRRVLECADPSLATLLAQDRSLRGLCTRLGERHLMLDPAGEPKARAALRKLGYPLGPTTR